MHHTIFSAIQFYLLTLSIPAELIRLRQDRYQQARMFVTRQQYATMDASQVQAILQILL